MPNTQRSSHSERRASPESDAPSACRRDTGAYYTPPSVARLLARFALRRCLASVTELATAAIDALLPLPNAAPEPPVSLPPRDLLYRKLPTLRVLDPAVGAGVFLTATLEEMAAALDAASPGGRQREDVPDGILAAPEALRAALAASCLHGIDVDPRAVALCRKALAEAAGPAAGGTLWRSLLDHVRPGDALYELPEAEYLGGDGAPGFDLVIGNPPWGATLAYTEKRRLRDRFELRGTVDTFALFLLRGIELLRPHGCLAMILPDILLLKNYPALRRRLLAELCLRDLVLLGPVFPGVTLDAIMLVAVREADPAVRAGNLVSVWRTVGDETGAKDGNGASHHPDGTLASHDGLTLRPLPVIAQSALEAADGHRFAVHLGEPERKLQRYMEELGVPLGELLDAHEGIHSGNVRQKIFVPGPRPPDGHPLLLGRDEVYRFYVRWAGRYVRYDRSLVDRSGGEYANLGRPEWFAAPKLVVRRTGDYLLAALDDRGYYCSNNLFVARLNPHSTAPGRLPLDLHDSDLGYLVALLNSTLLTWYFRSIQPRAGRPFAELKLVHLRRLPIVLPSEAERQAVADLAADLASKRATNPSLAKDDPQATKDSLYQELEERVFRLYGLGDAAVTMVRATALPGR